MTTANRTDALSKTHDEPESAAPSNGKATAIGQGGASSAKNESGSSLGYEIELVLTELSEEVRDDPSGKEIPNRLHETLESLSCDSALTYLALLRPTSEETPTPSQGKTANRGFKSWFGGSKRPQQSTSTATDNPRQQDEEVCDRLQKQVVRFLKIPDKYISWTSIMLKSQAFHKTHNIEGNQQQRRPIIELPRTEYQKPYIPSTIKYDSFPEVNIYPISVSHQFPFVGLARLVVTEICQQPQHRPLVGLDIVTFDDYNPRLYDSVHAFLQVFESSFTQWEWNCVQSLGSSGDNNNDMMLPEFYLRWATKEAYTKALGVGMGLSFESFETHLSGITENENDSGGIYTWLLDQCEELGVNGNDMNNHNQQSFEASGKVVINPGMDTSKSEECTFFFRPLWDAGIAPHNGSSTDVRMKGCACICLVLPQTKQRLSSAPFQLTTNWQSLDDLIAWHENK